MEVGLVKNPPSSNKVYRVADVYITPLVAIVRYKKFEGKEGEIEAIHVIKYEHIAIEFEGKTERATSVWIYPAYAILTQTPHENDRDNDTAVLCGLKTNYVDEIWVRVDECVNPYHCS